MSLRYSLTRTQPEIESSHDARFNQPWNPSYNIAPLALVPIITADEPRQIILAQWGFIPAHSLDPKSGLKYPVATHRECLEYPPLRAALKHRRCVVIIDGFYCWKKVKGGYLPYRLEHKKGSLLLVAGLYNTYTLPDGHELYSFCTLLSKPNALVSQFESLMPFILSPSHITSYLSCPPVSFEPSPASILRISPVDTDINDPSNDYASLIKPCYDATPAKYHPHLHKA